MVAQAGVTVRYVTRIAHLAPDITEAAPAGTQPRSLSLKTLLKMAPHS